MQTTLKKNAPCGMTRGSTTADHNMVYIMPRGSYNIYGYHVDKDKWKTLPSSPVQNSGLVLRDNTLVTVAGITSQGITNKLFSLKGKKWKKKIPPLNTVRYSPTVVTHSHYMFVIGGRKDFSRSAVIEVEMLDQNNTWTLLNNLPHPLYFPSATVCGSELYVISGGGEGFSCSLDHIVTSSHPERSPPALNWIPIPELPVLRPNSACLLDKLLLVGGIDRKTGGCSSTLYTLSHGQWEETGCLSSSRKNCLVASPSESRMVIVGGNTYSNTYSWFLSDVVETCTVV